MFHDIKRGLSEGEEAERERGRGGRKGESETGREFIFFSFDQIEKSKPTR